MKVTKKYDVYSFGVLALEIIMGKYPSDLIMAFLSSTSSIATTSKAYNLLLKDVLDQRLSTYPLDSVAEVVIMIAKIAFACLNESPRSRPTMEHVCKELIMPKSPLAIPIQNITIGHLI